MTAGREGPAAPPFPPHEKPLALTMGDPAGVGPDLAIMAWARRDAENLAPFLLYADPDLIAARAAALGAPVRLAIIRQASEAMSAFRKALPLKPIPLAGRVTAGRPDSGNAAATIAAIDAAVGDVRAGDVAAVVTNPIAKWVLQAAGFRHPGHTEYLGELARRLWPDWKTRPVMLLAVETPDVTLRVAPLTIHVALREVANLVTSDLIVETATTLADALARDFGVSRPRLAVAGLNPHAGENGAMGSEDRDVIAPAVATLAARGFNVAGPHSADALFYASARSRYDAVIAMYHDQALIPVKTLAFEDAVNATLGLPFIRTSPDHGSAFDLAGTGRASPSSLIAALKMASRMAARRAETAA